jgi:hypothetical protein
MSSKQYSESCREHCRCPYQRHAADPAGEPAPTPPWRTRLDLRKNAHRVDCARKFHGESYGWECQCLYDDKLAYGRRFVLRTQTLEQHASSPTPSRLRNRIA